jgi:hypothetical protein
MQRGLISELDAQTIESTLRLVLDGFQEEIINVFEVGLFNCHTSEGICSFIESMGRRVNFTGIDNERDKPIVKPFNFDLIISDSNEAYKSLTSAYHFGFIDANHSFPYVVSDFFCYESRIMVGGFLCFHDTGRHIKDFVGYQCGDIHDKDSYIAVRKALKKIGLLDNKFEGWELVFDRADESDEMGGVVVLKRIA